MPKEFWKFPPGTPNISVTGWFQGGTLKFGNRYCVSILDVPILKSNFFRFLTYIFIENAGLFYCELYILEGVMLIKLLLWIILLLLCWPVAILALLLYPIVWLFLLPFRLVGIAVNGLFAFIKALFLLPARILGGA